MTQTAVPQTIPLNTAVEQIARPYEVGHAALLVTGRSLLDLVLHSDGRIRPLIESLRQTLHARDGMLIITYCIAQGLDWSRELLDEPDRRTVEKVLGAHGLLDIQPDQNEIVRVIRGISSLCRTPTQGLKWSNSQDMRFAFLFLFAEHLTPGSLTNGTQTDSQIVATELSHLTAQSLALRASGNLVIFHGREGLVDELLARALYRVCLRQPDLEEKKQFLGAAMSLYDKAQFDDGLTLDSVAHLTTNTPNRGLEALLLASHRSGTKITGKELANQKNRDVEEISEHTLTVLETESVKNVQLSGRNVIVPLSVLERFAEALTKGNPSMPANVLLVGPPGSGKTDMARLCARRAHAATYQVHSPKGGIVGETERKATLQQSVLREWVPNIAFSDEVTEALPLERSDFNGDSGASAAVTAALLTALSDESRRGKSLFIGTTNCPWRMGAAMRSRFTVVPLLHALPEDLPGIILAIAESLSPGIGLDPNDPCLRQAANIFYEKGANPRHIRAALSNALLSVDALSPEAVLYAAQDVTTATDLLSTIYADLWAVKVCSSRSFLPWSSEPKSYPFPPHLKEIVDPSTGDVNQTLLDRRIEELRPHGNL